MDQGQDCEIGKLRSAEKEMDRKLGARMREIRTTRRMSMEMLATRVGVTYQQVQKYETGANRISASRLMRVALTLNVHVVALFEELGSPVLNRPVSELQH